MTTAIVPNLTPSLSTPLTHVFVLASKPGEPPYTVTLRGRQPVGCSCRGKLYHPGKPDKHEAGIAAGRFIPAGECPSCGISRDECLPEAVRVPDGTLRHLLDACKRGCGAAGGWSVKP